jgi:ArsR family transcriptional regulator
MSIIHRQNIALLHSIMSIIISESFSIKDNRVARYAKALSHPARIAILRTLMDKGGCTCGDIVSGLPLSQSTTSQHIKELKDARLLKRTTEGTSALYSIDMEEWELAQKYFNRLFECNTQVVALYEDLAQQ